MQLADTGSMCESIPQDVSEAKAQQGVLAGPRSIIAQTCIQYIEQATECIANCDLMRVGTMKPILGFSRTNLVKSAQ
jgi:hypothetical protein